MGSGAFGFIKNLLSGVSPFERAGVVSARQLVPENLSSMREEGASSLRAASQSAVEPPVGQPGSAVGKRLIDKLQIQRLSDEGVLPGGKSIPELPPTPALWERAASRRSV